MSDADEPDVPDADAWASACEEDLAAEKARRRAEHGRQPASAAEELRRLADAVSEKVGELSRPFGGAVGSATAQGVAQQLIAQAKAAIEPVVERNPQVFDHLAAAGGELLAAYRSAVQEAEGRWTAGGPGPAGPDGTASGGRPGSGAAGGAERIDLDKNPGGRAGGPGSGDAGGQAENGRPDKPGTGDEE